MFCLVFFFGDLLIRQGAIRWRGSELRPAFFQFPAPVHAASTPVCPRIFAGLVKAHWAATHPHSPSASSSRPAPQRGFSERRRRPPQLRHDRLGTLHSQVQCCGGFSASQCSSPAAVHLHRDAFSKKRPSLPVVLFCLLESLYTSAGPQPHTPGSDAWPSRLHCPATA